MMSDLPVKLRARLFLALLCSATVIIIGVHTAPHPAGSSCGIDGCIEPYGEPVVPHTPAPPAPPGTPEMMRPGPHVRLSPFEGFHHSAVLRFSWNQIGCVVFGDV